MPWVCTRRPRINQKTIYFSWAYVAPIERPEVAALAVLTATVPLCDCVCGLTALRGYGMPSAELAALSLRG